MCSALGSRDINKIADGGVLRCALGRVELVQHPHRGALCYGSGACSDREEEQHSPGRRGLSSCSLTGGGVPTPSAEAAPFRELQGWPQASSWEHAAWWLSLLPWQPGLSLRGAEGQQRPVEQSSCEPTAVEMPQLRSSV